jgi:hypothetical protein
MITWKETLGGGWRAQAGDFAISVYWSHVTGEKWRIYVNGKKPKPFYQTLEEAKAAAVEQLRIQLLKALKELEP